MTIASCFIQNDGPPVFVTDVLVTIKDEGEFTQLRKKWHNQASPPSSNFREVMHIRKVHIINKHYCVVWSADEISLAIEAISNLENIIDYFDPESRPHQIRKFFESISASDPYSLILAEVYQEEDGKFFNRIWKTSNVDRFDHLDVTGLISGSGVDLLRNGEICVPAPAAVKGNALHYALNVMATCLTNEVASRSFQKYRLGAYYELTIWDDGWKNISIPLNLLIVHEENGNKIARFLSYSRIHYTEIVPMCVSMDPLEFIFEGNADEALSSVLIDPFMNWNPRTVSLSLWDILQEPSSWNITILFNNGSLDVIIHADSLIDFNLARNGGEASKVLNYEILKEYL